MTPPRHNGVLWCAAAGFALLLAAWTTLFLLAHTHKVEAVPVLTRSGGS